jgi:ABC-type sugar transport system permease subunit
MVITTTDLFTRASQTDALVLPLHIYRTGFVDKNMGYASAISIVLFLIIMIFTAISQRINRVDWEY